SSDLEYPEVTPFMMPEIMLRDIPQHERAKRDWSRGVTKILPFSRVASTFSTSANLISPFGPLTDRFCPLRFTVTPAGTGTGFFPIRDIGPNPQNTVQMTSPPTFWARASASDITPL